MSDIHLWRNDTQHNRRDFSGYPCHAIVVQIQVAGTFISGAISQSFKPILQQEP